MSKEIKEKIDLAVKELHELVDEIDKYMQSTNNDGRAYFSRGILIWGIANIRDRMEEMNRYYYTERKIDQIRYDIEVLRKIEEIL